jgi:hypothetical protein
MILLLARYDLSLNTKAGLRRWYKTISYSGFFCRFSTVKTISYNKKIKHKHIDKYRYDAYNNNKLIIIDMTMRGRGLI